MVAFLPGQEHLDYEVGALFRSHSRVEEFRGALGHTISTLVWQGPAAERFKNHFVAENRKLNHAISTMYEFATAYRKLVDDVATLRGAIGRAESEVTDALHHGRRIPDPVWHRLGLQPGQLPPTGAVEWVDLARALGDNPIAEAQQTRRAQAPPAPAPPAAGPHAAVQRADRARMAPAGSPPPGSSGRATVSAEANYSVTHSSTGTEVNLTDPGHHATVTPAPNAHVTHHGGTTTVHDGRIRVTTHGDHTTIDASKHAHVHHHGSTTTVTDGPDSATTHGAHTSTIDATSGTADLSGSGGSPASSPIGQATESGSG